MNRIVATLVMVFALSFLSCGGNDKSPTAPGGWTVILDSHEAGSWQAARVHDALFTDGEFSATGSSGLGEWRSKRLDLSPFREARLRCRMTRPMCETNGYVYVFFESNVPGTRDLSVVTAPPPLAVADSSFDVSLENGLGWREASVFVHLEGGWSYGGNQRVSVADLQVVGKR